MPQETAYKKNLYQTIKANKEEYYYCPACDCVFRYDSEKDINVFICWYSELAWDFELKSTNCGCNY